MVKVPVKLPSLAGKHVLKVVAGTKTTTKNFTYGTSVTAKLTKVKTVKAKKTATIAGSFGYKAGKVAIKITTPKGKTVTKIVSLNSRGKFSYKYKTGSAKGSYKVEYSYRANAKYYGAKSYKLSFRVK